MKKALAMTAAILFLLALHQAFLLYSEKSGSMSGSLEADKEYSHTFQKEFLFHDKASHPVQIVFRWRIADPQRFNLKLFSPDQAADRLTVMVDFEVRNRLLDSTHTEAAAIRPETLGRELVEEVAQNNDLRELGVELLDVRCEFLD